MSNQEIALNARQAAILDVLRSTRGFLSTTEIREQVNSMAGVVLVAEQVYRALLILDRRGLVERVRVEGSVKAHWRRAGRHIEVGHRESNTKPRETA
ncbi:ferric uptake regulator [Mycolicibacterium conceptionense]|uniref:Ferric uptake regulator n=1 Tax=Mycolicibacterium conceptionense TaxID=451644 RepID=A0A0U1E1I2_9MYCO|nr:transcriptional repressor [Mycolicibacterium conceptionense]ORV21737.1 hypothetical protein AWB98_27180 [Mycolicibacterium conceptionense]CQD25060.1 ferric uptake regulator [Mycolicibacterium conceptionense]